MTSLPVRVIKLGGSLLDWPDWAGQLRRWLAAQSPAAGVLVVGGGALVDRLRELDRVAGLPAETAHWLAVRAMSLTAAAAAHRLAEATLVRSPGQLQLSSLGAPQILDVEEMLRHDQGTPAALPCSWDVTSDSIAARVATTLDAQELVLLKSSLPAPAEKGEAWAEAGFVDAYFARAARGLAVRIVDLRDPDFRQVVA
jgi:aspartokinase-like uncharacterized kinase